MPDLRTIRIPASVDVAIDYLNEKIDVGKPVHAVGTWENPDDFCMAFYADTGSDAQDHALMENHRASLIALAAARKDEETPTLIGDILLAVEPALADKIVANDIERQRDKESVKAFRAWLLSYSEVNDVDPSDVFYAVASYVAHVAHETMEAARHDHAQQIASLLGIDPEQVGIMFV